MPDTTLDDIPDKPDKKEEKQEGEKEKKEKEEKPEEKQEEEKEKKEKRWVADDYDDSAEVIKLQVGESIEGLLLDKYPSVKWKPHMIFKIQVKDDEIPKIIVGTTILDKMMKNKEISEVVKIERLADGVDSSKGNPLQNWKTYHLE